MVAVNTVYSIKFWLPLRENILIDALKKSGFDVIPIGESAIPLLPGLSVERSPKRLASRESVNVDWDVGKYMLIFQGNLEEIIEYVKEFIASLTEMGYNHRECVEYFEIIIKFEHTVENFVKRLRENLKISLDLLGEKLFIHSISFSNKISPISSENFFDWYSCIIEPDLFSKNKVHMKLIRRLQDYEKTLDFLNNVKKLEEKIISNLIGE